METVTEVRILENVWQRLRCDRVLKLVENGYLEEDAEFFAGREIAIRKQIALVKPALALSARALVIWDSEEHFCIGFEIEGVIEVCERLI